MVNWGRVCISLAASMIGLFWVGTALVFAQSPAGPSANPPGSSSAALFAQPPGIEEMTPEELARQNDALRQQNEALQRELVNLRGQLEPPEPTAPVGLQFEIEVLLSGVLAKGNADALTMQGTAHFVLYDLREFEFRTTLEYELLQARNQTEQHLLYHSSRFDLEPDALLSPFLFLTNGFQEKRKISWHFDVGAGVTLNILRQPWELFQFRENPFARYAVSLAIVFEHSQFQPNAQTDHETFLRMLLDIVAEQQIVQGLSAGVRFHLRPALQNFSDWTIGWQMWLDLRYDSHYRTRFEYRFSEDSRPPGGVRRVDHEMRFVVDITIR